MINSKGNYNCCNNRITRVYGCQSINMTYVRRLLIPFIGVIFFFPAYSQVDTFIFDINTSGSSFPGGFTIAGSKLFFYADNPISGSDAWFVDCLMADADILDHINPMGSSDPDDFTVLGDKVFFEASNGMDGRELWWYDCSDGNTYTENINPNPASSSFVSEFTPLDDKMFFSASDGFGNDEFWWYDCSADALFNVDINPTGQSSPGQLTALGDKIFFSADDGKRDRELWIYDCGINDTIIVDINPLGTSSPGGFTTLGDKMFFTANDGTHGFELWWYDCLSGDTSFVDINLESGSNPSELTAIGDKLFFEANDSIHGDELWWYDCGDGSLHMIDINPGDASSFPSKFTVIEDKIFFVADDGSRGRELYWFDCSTGDTSSIDIRPGFDMGSSPSHMTALGDKLFFEADDGIHGDEPWWFDCSTGDTSFIDVNPSGDSNPDDFILVHDKVFFKADDGTHDQELWWYDCSTGDVSFIDFNPNGSSEPDDFIGFCGGLVLSANDGKRGNEIWVVQCGGPEISVYYNATFTSIPDSSAPSVFNGTEFGEVAVCDMVMDTFWIANTGRDTLKVSDITISGVNGSNATNAFTFEFPFGASVPFDLDPFLDAEAIKVTYAPTVPGRDSAVITIFSNDSTEATFDLFFAAEAKAPQLEIVSDGVVLPDSVPASMVNGTDFGLIFKDSMFMTRFWIRNSGSDSLCIINISLAGINGSNATGAFTQQVLGASGFPFKIGPGSDSVALKVAYTPTVPGKDSAIVTVESDDKSMPDFDFFVSGEGVMFMSADSFGQGGIMAVDPCDCNDALSLFIGPQFYFHNIMTVMGPPGLDLRLLVNDGQMRDNAGMPLSVNTTVIPEIGMMTGIYQLEFWHLSGISTTVTYGEAGGQGLTATFSSSTCDVSICPPIVPTLGEWGLILLGLVCLIVGVLGLRRVVASEPISV